MSDNQQVHPDEVSTAAPLFEGQADELDGNYVVSNGPRPGSHGQAGQSPSEKADTLPVCLGEPAQPELLSQEESNNTQTSQLPNTLKGVKMPEYDHTLGGKREATGQTITDLWSSVEVDGRTYQGWREGGK